ncbi:MAG: recombinase family protein [Deltaproteobacteria bacterium]|nr:recombinase family protein [Deltaproteobacteria bacterium]
MLVGYARVSTAEQSLHLQRDALKKAGCKRIFTDVASGTKTERPGLGKALDYVRGGDTLVVWKLDRLGRSLTHLIDSVHALQARKVGFRSLQESLDTRTSGGKLVFHVFGALAEFERDIIRERTSAGLAAARARGRRGGRPRVLDEKKTALARTLHKEGTPTAVICATLGISRSSLYRYLAAPPPPAAPAKANRSKAASRRTPATGARTETYGKTPPVGRSRRPLP